MNNQGLPKSRFRRNIGSHIWPWSVKLADDVRIVGGWAPVTGWVDYYRALTNLEAGYKWKLAPLEVES